MLLSWLPATLSHAQISSMNTLSCGVAAFTSAAKAPKQFLLQLSIFSPWKPAISWYCFILSNSTASQRPSELCFLKWQSLPLSALLITCLKTACPFTEVTVYYVDGYFCFLQATGRKDHAKNLMHLYLAESKYPRGLWIFGGFLGGKDWQRAGVKSIVSFFD